MLELLAERERLDAALLGAVGELDTSGEWSADGTASTHACWVHHGRVTGPEASRLVRGGRLVQRHDGTAKRLHEARVTCAQVDALARATRGHEELFDEHEETLLDVAGDLAPEQLRVVMRRWRAIADDVDGTDEPHRSWKLRRLHVSTLDDGSVQLEAGSTPSPARRSSARSTRSWIPPSTPTAAWRDGAPTHSTR